MAEETDANTELVLAVLAFSLLLDRYALTLQNKAGSRLARLRDDLSALVAKADPTGPARLKDRNARLRKVLDESGDLIKTAYTDLNRDLRTALRDLAELVQDRAALEAERATGTPILTRRTPEAELRSQTDTLLIMGVAVKLWLGRHAGDLTFRLESGLLTLLSQQQSLADVLSFVRGSEVSAGADGVTGISTRHIAALIVAAVHATANAARNALYRLHPDIVRGVLHLSRLDERTTSTCRPRHMKRWMLDGTPIGHGLPYLGIPPLHWGCRSAVVPIFMAYNDLPARIRSKVDPGRFTQAPPKEPTSQNRESSPISASQLKNSI